ncbi:hypothetical protein [Pectobacterium phage Mimer]
MIMRFLPLTVSGFLLTVLALVAASKLLFMVHWITSAILVSLHLLNGLLPLLRFMSTL